MGKCGILKTSSVTITIFCKSTLGPSVHISFSLCRRRQHHCALECDNPDVLFLFCLSSLSSAVRVPQDSPQPDHWVPHCFLLGEHHTRQAIAATHQRPHSQEQELGQHRPPRLQRKWTRHMGCTSRTSLSGGDPGQNTKIKNGSKHHCSQIHSIFNILFGHCPWRPMKVISPGNYVRKV